MDSGPYKDPKLVLNTLYLIVELKVINSIGREVAFKMLDKLE